MYFVTLKLIHVVLYDTKTVTRKDREEILEEMKRLADVRQFRTSARCTDHRDVDVNTKWTRSAMMLLITIAESLSEPV